MQEQAALTTLQVAMDLDQLMIGCFWLSLIDLSHKHCIRKSYFL